MYLVVSDIDGTLAELSHRIGFVRTKPANWKAFNAAMVNDTVIEPVAHICRTMIAEGHTVILASGRSENNRPETEKWLKENNITGYHKLLMRNKDDNRDDTIVKYEILLDIMEEFGKKPDMVFDDRPKVVRMWREQGIFVFNCAQSDEEF